jgi:hypothetical protein
VQGIFSLRGFCHAKDFSTQRVFPHGGFCRVGDFVAQSIFSHRGFLYAEDFVTQRVFLRKGFFHAKGFVAQRVLLCTGYMERCVNDWFSGQNQDHFLTYWRGILKITESFLSRTNKIIKISLIFSKSFIFR